MNVRRFTARTSREALGLAKEALGQEAMVLSTRPCGEGVEVLAMAPDSLPGFDDVPPAALPADTEQTTPAQDADRLAMSTLSFLDYVRERMLRRRRAELQGQPAPTEPALGLLGSPAALEAPPAAAAGLPAARSAATSAALGAAPDTALPARRAALPLASADAARALPRAPLRALSPESQATAADARPNEEDDGFRPFGGVRDEPRAAFAPDRDADRPADPVAAERVLQELRDVRTLIEQRFGELAYLDKIDRQPRQARLLQHLLEAGFSPALCRRVAEGLPAEGDELAWVTTVLERNLPTGEREPALEDSGGVLAMIGPTGVGKTTSTAKLAAAFAARHGSGHLGLITLDAYRMGAHEQLRAYGKILGVPVYTASDRASLEDLLDLLSAKRLVLIDTAGMPQRDERTRELLEMLSHRLVQRLLVISATAQGETIEDVISAYGAAQCRGVVLSKLDEAARLGPALDALIRHKLKVLAVANGQRVPEDWHRLTAATLVQRALRVPAHAAWKLNLDDVRLAFVDRAQERSR